jgi:ABC-2 type transport system ATP-binding protein
VAIIDVQHISKRYGDLEAVSDVSFEVSAGEIFGLLGPNGAGKTTTVECIQGLRVPDSGRIHICGHDPHTEPALVRPLIGSQLQESSLPDRIKVREALDLFSCFGSAGRDWHLAMEEWGLGQKSEASFASLSGGQRQRLLVALALLNRPRVVFLDEMTTGLDPAARRTTWELIERIRSEGTTVVLVTHFMDEAERLCDRLAIVDNGSVIATGTPAQLVAEHVFEVTIRFSMDDRDAGWLRSVPGVNRIERHGNVVLVTGEPSVVAPVGASMVEHGLAPDDFTVERPSLEDVYLDLVGGGGS